MAYDAWELIITNHKNEIMRLQIFLFIFALSFVSCRHSLTDRTLIDADDRDDSTAILAQTAIMLYTDQKCPSLAGFSIEQYQVIDQVCTGDSISFVVKVMMNRYIQFGGGGYLYPFSFLLRIQTSKTGCGTVISSSRTNLFLPDGDSVLTVGCLFNKD